MIKEETESETDVLPTVFNVNKCQSSKINKTLPVTKRKNEEETDIDLSNTEPMWPTVSIKSQGNIPWAGICNQNHKQVIMQGRVR